MAKICVKNYCSKTDSGSASDGENIYFMFEQKGAAVTAAAAYPAGISRSGLACRKVLEISTESFIRRPSLSDIAVSTISSFINDGVFIYQEQDKKFLCSSAICYVYKEKARFIVSGNAAVYHFRDRQLVYSLRGQGPMFGEKLHWKEKAEPEIDISQGENAFILCSADENDVLPVSFPEPLFLADMEAEECADAAVSYFKDRKCSAACMILPQKTSIGKKIFGSSKGGSFG